MMLSTAFTNLVIEKLILISGEDKKWSTLVYNFTQDTTFHGVRYITAETPYISRR